MEHDILRRGRSLRHCGHIDTMDYLVFPPLRFTTQLAQYLTVNWTLTDEIHEGIPFIRFETIRQQLVVEYDQTSWRLPLVLR